MSWIAYTTYYTYSYVTFWIFSFGCGNQTELQRAFLEDRYDTSDTIDTEFERWVLTQLGR